LLSSDTTLTYNSTEVSENVDGRRQRVSVVGMLKCVLVRLNKNRVDLTGSAARPPHGNLVARVVGVDGSINEVLAIRVGDVRQIT
jgi:hypothetical protein